jgi:hypothetical protein
MAARKELTVTAKAMSWPNIRAGSFAELAYKRWRILLPNHLVPVTDPDVARAAFADHPDVGSWTAARRRRWTAIWEALVSRMDTDGVMVATHGALAEQASSALGEQVSPRLSSEVLSWAGSGLQTSAGLLFPVNRSGTGVMRGDPAYVMPVPGTKESLNREHVQQLEHLGGRRFQQLCVWLDDQEAGGMLRPDSPTYVRDMLAMAETFDQDRRAVATVRAQAQRQLSKRKRPRR